MGENMDMKAVISTKDGKSYVREIKGSNANSMIGKKIGEVINGELIDLTGYELMITGGSTNAGFAMRKDMPGQVLKKIFTTRSIGVRKVKKGQKVRKTVAGNTISQKTAAINLKVVKAGKTPLAPEVVEKADKTEKTEEKAS